MEKTVQAFFFIAVSFISPAFSADAKVTDRPNPFAVTVTKAGVFSIIASEQVAEQPLFSTIEISQSMKQNVKAHANARLKLDLPNQSVNHLPKQSLTAKVNRFTTRNYVSGQARHLKFLHENDLMEKETLFHSTVKNDIDSRKKQTRKIYSWMTSLGNKSARDPNIQSHTFLSNDNNGKQTKIQRCRPCKCKITKGSKCHVKVLFEVDCSCCALDKVPILAQSNFIRSLNLSNNNLTERSLFKGVFANFTSLKNLYLACNRLRQIKDGMFDGLNSLQRLILMWNDIRMDRHLNSTTAFQPLTSTLHTLVLNGNTPLSDISSREFFYPEFALSCLKNLSELHLDGLTNKSFGFGFSKMTKLQTLHLAGFFPGYCLMTSLKDYTFRYVSSIKHLNISGCSLHRHYLHKETFSPLKNLESLDLSHNYGLSIGIIGHLMHGLRNNHNFKYLRMRLVVERFSPCVVVFQEDLKNFQNTSLEVIEAQDNGIEMIESGAIQYLPSTLKKVNLINNRIMFGAYWNDLGSLSGLRELYLDRLNIAYRFPDHFPEVQLKCRDKNHTTHNDRRQNGFKTSKFLTLQIPPQLEKVSMNYSRLAYKIDKLKFGKNSLKEAYLKGNSFKYLLGPVTGLKSLTKLDLSDCFIEQIDLHFLKSFDSLEYLNLYQNLLGDWIRKDEEGRLFEKMRHLMSLNISFNNLYDIPQNYFRGCQNLRMLDLSVNRIKSVNFSIAHMDNLSFFGLSKNSISSLNKGILDHIDKILKSGRKFYLDLQFNPITCDCSNLQFLRWVTSRKVLVGNFSDYKCVFPDAPMANMSNGYDELARLLERECESQQSVFVYILCCTILVSVIILICIAYRFRWSLRYWYFTVKLMILNSKSETSSQEFDYDVFICYAHNDDDFVMQELYEELSTNRGLQLMIHSRSFEAGAPIIDNIVMAVRKARKTLVIFTRSMIKSKWCLYELQMARMESINTGRNVLVFMFLEKIPYKDMDLDLISYVKSNVVISYPSNPQHRKLFWDRLAHSLKN